VHAGLLDNKAGEVAFIQLPADQSVVSRNSSTHTLITGSVTGGTKEAAGLL